MAARAITPDHDEEDTLFVPDGVSARASRRELPPTSSAHSASPAGGQEGSQTESLVHKSDLDDANIEIMFEQALHGALDTFPTEKELNPKPRKKRAKNAREFRIQLLFSRKRV